MIPYPPHSETAEAVSKRNGEGGFPHSEIAGSKPAHGSPTLIAACHVLHRLCMPRHPPNALTSRLRVRTTNGSPAWIICPYVRSTSPHELVAAMRQLNLSLCNDRRGDTWVTPCVMPRAIGRCGIDCYHSQCQRRLYEDVCASTRSKGLTQTPRAADLHRRMSFPAILDSTGGAYRDRTDDPLLAKQVLSQLS